MEKHLTLREKILENIRDAIVSGHLKAGSRVSEPELAERYGISRTPIREAFRQLESKIPDGYPRRGAIVSELSPKDVEEFYAIKSIMEGYAARRACEYLSEKILFASRPSITNWLSWPESVTSNISSRLTVTFTNCLSRRQTTKNCMN